MSKPESAGDSLESILASIRKGLAEQSTDALSERAAAPQPSEPEAKQRRRGLAQRLAGAAPEDRAAAPAGIGDDLSDLLENPAPPARQPAEPAERERAAPRPTEPPETGPNAAAESDPLWFLTKRDEPNPDAAAGPVPAPSDKAERAEPALTRPEVFRASLPPFFGSSAPDSPTVEPAPRSGPVAAPQAPAPAPKPAGDAVLAHEVSLVAAAAEQAAARPPSAAPAPPAMPNGKAADGEPSLLQGMALDSPQNRALEAMVLELLKPMLRQWLDENMPRLVAEALDDEVKRVRQRGADAGKT